MAMREFAGMRTLGENLIFLGDVGSGVLDSEAKTQTAAISKVVSSSCRTRAKYSTLPGLYSISTAVRWYRGCLW